MPSERKIQIVKNLKEKLARAEGIVLTNYQGLSVPELEELRRKLADAKVDYQVVKNTLLELALKDTSYELPAESYQLTGPTAVVLSYEDEIKPLKVLDEFAEEHEAFEIKSGFFDGIWQTGEKIMEIAKLPSQEELRARLVGMLQSPMARLVRLAKADQTKLVQLLSLITKEVNLNGRKEI